MLNGVPHPALSHGHLADLHVHEHRHVTALGEAPPGSRGVVESRFEFRGPMVADA